MAEERKMSFVGQIGSLPLNFWAACFMEILERLAFFGVRAIAPLYLVKTAGENGLGLSYADKGMIYGVWAVIQCFVPMVSGGYTDRYGYRKSLAVAFVINILGYLLMARSLPIAEYFAAGGWEDAGYWVFMTAACLVGLGTAIFKPPAQGTIARSTNEETSSMGWGVFYWMVNIGGALAPMGAALLRVEIDWQNVFYAAAIVTALNFLPAFTLFKEPPKEPPPDGEGEKGIFGTFLSSISNIFGDLRLVAFMGIFSCFWLMFMQLWDLLPNFIDEWVNTSDVAGVFGWFSGGWVQENGQVKPEMVINIDSIAIILLVIPISWLIKRIHKVAAMVIGMAISLVGLVGAGSTSVGFFCCAMVFVFSIGEMVCSPTFSAYVGLIAPKGKKALYMGYSQIPFGIGWCFGNFISGFLYDNVSSKFRFARDFLIDKLGMSTDFVQNTELLPNERVMETMTRAMEAGEGASLQQALQANLDKVDWSVVPQKEFSEKLFANLDEVLQVVEPEKVQQATQVLWDLHHPYMVWYYLGVIGLLGTLGMMLFYLFVRKEQSPVTEDAA
jgi:POT family proton-dependent oligopeptide transporter